MNLNNVDIHPRDYYKRPQIRFLSGISAESFVWWIHAANSSKILNFSIPLAAKWQYYRFNNPVFNIVSYNPLGGLSKGLK